MYGTYNSTESRPVVEPESQNVVKQSVDQNQYSLRVTSILLLSLQFFFILLLGAFCTPASELLPGNSDLKYRLNVLNLL